VCPQMAIASVRIVRCGPHNEVSRATAMACYVTNVTQLYCLRRRDRRLSVAVALLNIVIFFLKNYWASDVCKSFSISGRLMAPMMAPIQWRRRENNRRHVDQIGRNIRKTAIQFNTDDSASAVISTEPAIDAAVNEGHSCGLGATSSGQFQIQPAALFTEIFR
jgi:hypothetical protein